jgi:hypothetical protein
MTATPYGWLPNEPDERDYSFETIARSHYLPAEVDLTVYLASPYLQGAAPSCVGFGIMHQIIIEERVHSIRGSIPSAAYIYAMARKQHQDELRITGTYPRYAYKGVAKLGCPSETHWHYSTDEDWLCTMPDDSARRHGMGRAGLQYYIITGNRCERIRQALADGHPVGFGTAITESFRQYDHGTIMHAPGDDEEILGGHFMCIVGYKSNYFVVANSWRRSPFILMHEDMIEWPKTRDFTVCTGWKDIA